MKQNHKIQSRLIAANWKMNPNSVEEAQKLLRPLLNFKPSILNSNLEIVICPPFCYLPDFKFQISSFYQDRGIAGQVNFKLGGQNCFWENAGAYTGEISPLMLKNLGAEYVLVGHSERRQYLGETDKMIAKKLKAVLENGLNPILCVGETSEQRKNGKTEEVIKKQLEEDLKETSNDEQGLNLTIAYEPIWAIGTGNECQSEESARVIKNIKNILDSKPPTDGLNFRVLYGGSVDSENITGYLKYPEIDGVLVGGDSLNIEDFIKLIESAIWLRQPAE